MEHSIKAHSPQAARFFLTKTMIKAIIPVFFSALYFLSANSTSMIDAEHDRMNELPALVSKGPVIGNP
mgnify:CR=1 FL=1